MKSAHDFFAGFMLERHETEGGFTDFEARAKPSGTRAASLQRW
jgi:hypothetical protein